MKLFLHVFHSGLGWTLLKAVAGFDDCPPPVGEVTSLVTETKVEHHYTAEDGLRYAISSEGLSELHQ